MNHIETGYAESAAATEISGFEQWAAKAEEQLGFSLDGDQQADGYSLDYAVDAYRQGVTIPRYVIAVRNAVALRRSGP